MSEETSASKAIFRVGNVEGAIQIIEIARPQIMGFL
jgi:hypothetical protein